MATGGNDSRAATRCKSRLEPVLSARSSKQVATLFRHFCLGNGMTARTSGTQATSVALDVIAEIREKSRLRTCPAKEGIVGARPGPIKEGPELEVVSARQHPRSPGSCLFGAIRPMVRVAFAYAPLGKARAMRRQTLWTVCSSFIRRVGDTPLAGKSRYVRRPEQGARRFLSANRAGARRCIFGQGTHGLERAVLLADVIVHRHVSLKGPARRGH